MRTTLHATLAALLLSAGCGNLVGEIPPPAGVTAVQIGADGAVEIVAYVCAPDVDSLVVYRDRVGLDEEEEENPLVGRWRHDGDLDGAVTFTVADSGPGWTPDQGVDLDGDRGYLVSLQSEERETVDVYLAGGWDQDLEPGVLYADTLSGDVDESGTLAPTTSEELAADSRRLCAADPI